MLCSVPTGKSGSNWLDRLRSSKGFPTADNLDLDHFLNNNNLLHDDAAHAPNPSASSPITNGASNSVNINSNSQSTQSDCERVTDRTSENEWFGIMTNVLSDLFNMGDQQFSGKKKSARKQTNPKFCSLISTNTSTSNNNNNNINMCCARKEAAAASFNSDKNSNNGNADCGGDYDDDDDGDVEEEKGGGGGDKELKGYSRSEVTVIDTSCGVWKFDKLVFRKKNIWKVRDKKGKSSVFGTKKRKPNDLEPGNENVGPNKKAKLSNSDFASSKDASDSQKQQDEKSEVQKETYDDISEVPKKRFQFSRSPRKSQKNGSSVILMKAIPTSKKSERNLPKNRLKDAQKQYKA